MKTNNSKTIFALLIIIMISGCLSLESIPSGLFITPKENKPQNFILITFDALSAEYLSTYGFEKETDPLSTAAG